MRSPSSSWVSCRSFPVLTRATSFCKHGAGCRVFRMTCCPLRSRALAEGASRTLLLPFPRPSPTRLWRISRVRFLSRSLACTMFSRRRRRRRRRRGEEEGRGGGRRARALAVLCSAHADPRRRRPAHPPARLRDLPALRHLPPVPRIHQGQEGSAADRSDDIPHEPGASSL